MKSYKISRMIAASLAVMLLACGCGSEAEQPEAARPGDVQIDTEIKEPETDPEPTAAPKDEEIPVTEEAAPEVSVALLEDGVYSARFDTDGSMFHINEVYEGRGILTVKDGKMMMHIVLPSRNTVNLYYGMAEDAQKDGAVLIDPVVESVTYPDGLTEDVNAFDIPVPYLDDTYDLALVGTKGKWYDHKVSVSDPQPVGEGDQGSEAAPAYEDGSYMVSVELQGGSGKASITSPAELIVKDGEMTLRVEWSSPHYDYMLVEGNRYDPVNTEGNSVFEIPVKDISIPLAVVADTTAMSEPHEIEYTITFDKEVTAK